MGYRRSAIALALLLASIAAAPSGHSPARNSGPRTIAFQLCNDTIDTAFFAVAYEGAQASRTAQGWTRVTPGRCNERDHVPLPAFGWFSYYVITQSGKNFQAGVNQATELICARPDDFTLERAGATDHLGTACPTGYDLLRFRKVDATTARAATYTVHLNDHGITQ